MHTIYIYQQCQDYTKQKRLSRNVINGLKFLFFYEVKGVYIQFSMTILRIFNRQNTHLLLTHCNCKLCKIIVKETDSCFL